jgi:hypothetical protein
VLVFAAVLSAHIRHTLNDTQADSGTSLMTGPASQINALNKGTYQIRSARCCLLDHIGDIDLTCWALLAVALGARVIPGSNEAIFPNCSIVSTGPTITLVINGTPLPLTPGLYRTRIRLSDIKSRSNAVLINKTELN